MNQSSTRTTQAVYTQIAANLRDKIQCGRWPVGTMLPSRRDLAKEYGVSPVTVERAVVQLIRDGVLRADDRRGTFVAHAERNGTAVISPSRRTTPATVGIVASLYMVDDTHLALNNFWVRLVLQALEHALSADGNATHFFNRVGGPGGPVIPMEQAIKAALADGADAVTVIALGADPDEIDRSLAGIRHSSVPLVCVTTGGLHKPIPHVFYDNRSAGYEAAQELLHQGHRDILFFAPFTASWVEERLEGVRAAVDHLGLSPEVVRVLPRHSGHWLIEEDPRILGYRAAQEAFAEGTGLSGVVSANDGVALGFLRAGAELGRRPGTDFAIVSFDDHPEARNRGLTSVRPPMEMMGKEAARLLVQALNGENSSTQVRCHGHLLRRASTHTPWINRTPAQ